MRLKKLDKINFSLDDPRFFECVYTQVSRGLQLRKLNAIADEAEHVMTTCVLDQQIARKVKAGNKFQSNIVHTKAKAGVKKKGNATNGQTNPQMFPSSNKSPLTSIAVPLRRTQAHPGKGSHIPWQQKKFCKYCNEGFASKCEQGILNFFNSQPSRL